MLYVTANEATAAQRRVYFDVRDGDGITPITNAAGGQPQISTSGAAWTATGIGVLVAIGNGRYYADLTQAAVATAGVVIQTRYQGGLSAETPGDSVLVVAFDPFDGASLGLTRLAGAEVVTVSPVASGGAVTIVRGDTYDNDDGRALEWSTSDAGTWPTLTSATVVFTLRNDAGQTKTTFSGSVVTATGANKKVRVELTAEQTTALVVGGHEYDVQATLSGGNVVTLVRGYAAVLEDFSP